MFLYVLVVLAVFNGLDVVGDDVKHDNGVVGDQDGPDDESPILSS